MSVLCLGMDASVNSLRSAVTTNAACSAMSTALSAIRSMLPCDQHVSERQLVLFWGVGDREGGLEHLPVELVDLVILDIDSVRRGEVTWPERANGVTELRAG